MSSLLIQRSIVEQFNFNGKKIRAVYVEGRGECLAARDVVRAVGYVDNDNGRRAVRTHVPQRYIIRYKDVKNVVKSQVNIDLPQPDTVLFTEPGLYCFLLRCGKPEAKSFVDCVIEEVLSREMRKLAGIIEEQDMALALLGDDLEDRDRQLVVLEDDIEDKERQLAVQSQENARLRERYVPHRRRIDNVQCAVDKNDPHEHGRAGRHNHFMIRCQRKRLIKRINFLKVRYPNMIVRKPECDDPNAVRAWCRFKEDALGKVNCFSQPLHTA